MSQEYTEYERYLALYSGKTSTEVSQLTGRSVRSVRKFRYRNTPNGRANIAEYKRNKRMAKR